MLVDLEILERNLKRMAEQCRSTGTRLRGHVKVHKSPEIAKRQMALGAIGVTCATVAECELMSRSGIRGALLTRQAVGKNAIGRLEARRKKSREDLAGLRETVELARKTGLPLEIVSGGSTGTYNIDTGDGLLTELQAGSFVFMDTNYRQIGGKDNPHVYADFEPALTVMTTVISQRHPRQCTIDAGNKAMLKPTDEVKGHPGIKVKNQGAEYGVLAWEDGERGFRLGERVELYPTLLDMSTAVYDRYYVSRGERVIDVWPIMGRGGAAQR